MTERPIIFSGAMVRAILDGRKTQTRRVVKSPPSSYATEKLLTVDSNGAVRIPVYDARATPPEHGWMMVRCPYGVPGDRLWVREAHEFIGDGRVLYKADGEERLVRDPVPYRPRLFRGRPGMHLPHWASRITLEITAVRVERLQEITEADCMAEGVSPMQQVRGILRKDWKATDAFERLWDSINLKRAPWASNPWVWVIEFRRVA